MRVAWRRTAGSFGATRRRIAPLVDPEVPGPEVEGRAAGGERCGYCQSPQVLCGYRFHLEHIVPRAAGGTYELSNLALSCGPCNLAKGARQGAEDPETGAIVSLFHPRTMRWAEHFSWADDATTVVGITPVGRATVRALDMNSPLQRRARPHWRGTGLFPGAPG